MLIALGAIGLASTGPLLARQGDPEPGQDPVAVGYAIGYDTALRTLEGLRSDKVDVDRQAMARGFADALMDAEPEMSRAEVEGVLRALEREVATRIAMERYDSDPVFRALAEENLRRSEAFLRRFEAGRGTQRLGESGILYRVIREGDGASPDEGSTVVVNFEIETIMGVEVGSGEGVERPLDAVIQGGQRVLSAMQAGDRWLVAMPPALAFGIGGRAPDLGPNEAVLIDVELVDVR